MRTGTFRPDAYGAAVGGCAEGWSCWARIDALERDGSVKFE